LTYVKSLPYTEGMEMNQPVTEYQVCQRHFLGEIVPLSSGHFPVEPVDENSVTANAFLLITAERDKAAREAAVLYARTCTESNFPDAYVVRKVTTEYVWATDPEMLP
jgi:hypothetical protein